MSLVSIILPYYKKINYIANTLNSILNQTYQNFEIILVYDDIRLDDLLLIENDFKNNPKIKVIKNARNLGAGISRNIGIKHSKGEIIAFIDADDLWLPNKLEKQTNFMKENNFQFTFCDYEKRISNNKVIKVISPKKFLDYNDLIKSNDIGLSTVQINKNIIPDDLFPSLKTKEDFVAWLKITKKKINAYNFSENLVIWNKVHNSLSSNFFQKISDGFKVYRDYEKFSLLKSLYFILILSKNSVKRKF
tara:strand:+ start:1323 stop:2066 length:744 start_codon:yes stop_codon:yes gene_type:complete